MFGRITQIASSCLLGVYVFVLYCWRSIVAASMEYQLGYRSLPPLTQLVFGSWLPRSMRLGVVLAACMVLVSAVLGLALRATRLRTAGVHAILWVLAVIALPVMLLARDVVMLPFSGRMIDGNDPVLIRQEQVEEKWFWSFMVVALLLVGTLAFRVVFPRALREKPAASARVGEGG